jgi:hypothetical protein
MTGTILLLCISYAVVAALLLNFNLATPYAKSLKLSAIVLVSVLYGISWWGFHQIQGWPASAPLPNDFRVLWISVQEPDKQTKSPGHIFYWVRELDEAGLAVGEPRAHSVSWDQDRAEQAQAALEKMEEGELINGKRSRNIVSESNADPSHANEFAGDPSASGSGGGRPEIEFVEVPPPSLPPKGDPPIQP